MTKKMETCVYIKKGKTTIWENKDQTKINCQYENQLKFDLAAK